ncbi:benzoate 1,2-dioxygenase large subunit [Burkholderia pseudomultivorans]|uniref:Benzoate 1,2-dioxygenase large subunit n=1 Tax=Burkholderia pseudomultivorans TaxID=1207504 RepID=A0A132EPL5_9BURK|nr:Rieske 2Fe-2S domain-containing protein [Burkholderia pseudomultivorans]EGD04706.1 benzoate 1,2-dioxygenase alpha subunit [Burkholderia sp. TJI49]AOI87382.1 benzoate 1,2-dioxygenase large subunit [Burkholderia pseudomultivorans]KVC37381.1 benzoate 1,2-dioxygenase large subunit [Burkholderia pseudomultivorans]KVC37767.1 benzoate 1,2-dioxygenase large subunit [Burkholderia pseudomultivorans]KVC39425.1 benzoate 1,2-dioxygenase large subunit [Burkholderia pseudomultivorans]
MSAIIDKANELDHLLATAVQDDKENGVFRCRRDIFTNQDLFDLEMKHIFESNWVYLAHESQIPNNNDYYTTWIGRQPIVITRDKTGELHAVINACAHKGAMLCRRKHGNKGSFTCPFHGWTFSNSGKLLKVKDEKTTEYPVQFNTNGSHDLKKVARFESYRGFLFGSLSADVLPLEDYLGEARVIIDQIVDQAPDGLEVLRGNSSYIYEGNWKMQMENGCDGYHVSTVHWNYAATMGRRKEDGTKAVDANSWSRSVAGVYGFEHGHILLWTQTMNPEVRPVYRHRDEIKARVGEVGADFIVNQTRNLCVYPNVFLMDQFSTQIRVVRPLGVDKTEVTIFCFAPKGESAEDRALRIRQYEDFFNVSGMGTADDLEEFRACQSGYAGATAMWNDLSRGAPLWIHGADENARKMGLKPLISGERSEDEGLFVCQHEYWVRVMRGALEKEREEALS